MKIFVSHSSKDIQVYDNLVAELEKDGHVVINSVDLNVGEIWINKLKDIVHTADLLIAIITENFLNSIWAQAELSSVIFSDNEIIILPVVVGDVFIPGFIAHIQCRRVRNIQEITQAVLADVKSLKTFIKGNSSNGNIISPNPDDDIDEKIDSLKQALKDNRLTLVCGSGISKDLNIPTWNELLIDILNDILNNQDNSKKLSAKQLLAIMPQSNLILGKYLKILLADDFEKIVQKHLYKNCNQVKTSNPNYLEVNNSELLKSVASIARPKRTGQRLDSIITFNFDDFIEQSLEAYGIDYYSIWKEGQVHMPEQLPIYHVHGFLPNKEILDNPNLVFSEEAYHSQFIDPYGWANLVQLSTYSSNICLFIGLSLSDPNLRRLLDISWRRNNDRKHYIIMKKQKGDTVSEIATMLFEQDANSLGLNVLWCSQYSEIPDLLKKIIVI